MWCKRCQQDVPGIAAGDRGIRCARCSHTISQTADSTADAIQPLEASRKSPGREPIADLTRSLTGLTMPLDSWQLDVEIAHAERLLQRSTPLLAEAERATRTSQANTDLERNRNAFGHGYGASIDSAAPQATSGGGLAWGVLMLATAALCCGGALAAWSFVPGKAHLWSLGLPVLIAGQAALLVGIVLQLSRAWQTSRAAASDLNRVGRELDTLRSEAAHSSDDYNAHQFSPHFYASANRRPAPTHRNSTR